MPTYENRVATSPRAGQRPGLRRAASVLILLGILALVAVAPIPAFTIRSGPVFSLADELSVDGTPAADALSGDYLFTTIALEGATTADLVRSWFTPSVGVISRARVIPAGVSDEDFLSDQQDSFDEAALNAAAAAAHAAGRDRIDIDVDNDIVGGPSAGLLTALAAFDVLAPTDLAAGRRIAGTGEVAADGTVDPVGSVELKVLAAIEDGADAFVLPSGQAEQARSIVGNGAMQVVPADTLGQAIDGLSDGG